MSLLLEALKKAEQRQKTSGAKPDEGGTRQDGPSRAAAADLFNRKNERPPLEFPEGTDTEAEVSAPAIAAEAKGDGGEGHRRFSALDAGGDDPSLVFDLPDDEIGAQGNLDNFETFAVDDEGGAGAAPVTGTSEKVGEFPLALEILEPQDGPASAPEELRQSSFPDLTLNLEPLPELPADEAPVRDFDLVEQKPDEMPSPPPPMADADTLPAPEVSDVAPPREAPSPTPAPPEPAKVPKAEGGKTVEGGLDSAKPAESSPPMRAEKSEAAKAGRRAGARAIFEAKKKDGNPSAKAGAKKTGYFLGGGLLALVAAAGGGYYVWQSTQQSHSSFGSPPAAVVPSPATEVAHAPEASPEQDAGVAPPEVDRMAAAAPVETPPGAQPPETPSAVPGAAEGSASPAAAPPQPPSVASATPAPSSPSVQAVAPVPIRAPEAESLPEPTPFEGIRITHATPPAKVDATLASAYDLFRRGDEVAALAAYKKVLARRPDDRDAILGLAALEARRGNAFAALSAYAKALELNPKDAMAQAGMISVNAGVDPVAAETRLKLLLDQHPDAGYLHYALGNVYALQHQWPAAQQAFFQAWSSDGANPDYAYNLAVSLDQLGKPKLALEYYDKAVQLAAGKEHRFDTEAVAHRLRELRAYLEQG